MRRHKDKLIDILVKIQNSPEYTDRDIMTFTGMIDNDKELLRYVKQKRKYM